MAPDRRRTVETAYRNALATPTPAEREALLLSLPADLRAEVEALLSNRDDDETATLIAPLIPAPGLQFSHYKLESKLGQGGMGSVYLATDSNLGRRVAVKFLFSDIADASTRRRFQKEARTASSLNHPHIVTVHDSGEVDGQQYIVTEFVDGGTLKDWAALQPRAWNEAVELIAGIAEALAAAHQAGIVHRDVKPANILVSASGHAKLADFGLVKVAAAVPQESSSTLTKTGTLIGTPAYMSPEQATGQPLDARSDIFSLGIVLYELLARRHPFRAPNEFAILRNILSTEAPPLPANIPAALTAAVEKALEKDPAHRYQAMREMVIDLKRVTRAPAAATPPPPSRGKMWPWVALAVLALIAMAVATSLYFTKAPPDLGKLLASAKFTRLTDWPGSEEDAAISRDGRFLAFRADRAGPMDTWVNQIGTNRFVNLTNGKRSTVLVRNVGFSADGSELWLSSMLGGDRMRLVPLFGDTNRPFLPERVINVAWSWDGKRIVYHPYDPGDAMFIAGSNGENPREIYKTSPDIHNHFPTWSRDGKWIYFVSGVWNAREMDVWRISPEGGKPERLTNNKTDAKYPIAFDERTVLYTSPDTNGAGPWLWALDTETRESKRISSGLEVYSSIDISADAKRWVVTIGKPTADLWTIPILDTPATEKDAKSYDVPSVRALAPRFGGKALFYLSASGTGDGLWRLENGQAIEIWRGADGALLEPAAVSADGTRVAIVVRKEGLRTLTTLSAEGGDARPLARKIDVTSAVSWSPDGKWIAAGGVDSHGPGLFKIPVDGGEPRRIATGPAASPVWSPDGSLIVYTGAVSGPVGPMLVVRPDGTPVEIPRIHIRVGTEHYRFIPGRQQLVYVPTISQVAPEHFWMLDFDTRQSRQLGTINLRQNRTFDITPDGKQILYDRIRQNSDVVLIELP